MDETQLLRIIDCALAAIGHPETARGIGFVRKRTVISDLLCLRQEIAPKNPAGLRAKVLRELEGHVRRHDMIFDDLWDREEPIRQIYNWCEQKLGRMPDSPSEMCEHVQDAVEALELG